MARLSDAAKFAIRVPPMDHPPIPVRIPPLTWRKPVFLWTPLALAAAIGWPALFFQNDGAIQKLTVVAGAAMFAVAMVTLGTAWATGKAPRTRRAVVIHVLFAGFVAAVVAPFVLTALLAGVADYEKAGDGARFSMEMSLTMIPLGILIGLPVALVSGIVFAWLGLTRAKLEDSELVGDSFDSQPFR